MQEYPKALYLAGAMAMAADHDQESELRDAGHVEWHVDQKRMAQGQGGAEAAFEPAKPDTAALDEMKAQLNELDSHLMAKADHLAAQEQTLALREEQLAAAEADLAARLAAISAEGDERDDGAAPPPEQPAEEKAPARSGKKQSAAQ